MIEICAEIGQTAEGSVDRSIEAVNAFAEAGATAVKFQWWASPDNLVVKDTPRYWSTNEAESQHAAFSSAGMIPLDGWGPVIDAARDAGVEFWTTPFDLESVAAAHNYGMTTLKIASGDVTNLMLIDAVGAVADRVILSTGGATLDEVGRAVDVAIGTHVRPLSSLYPRCEVVLLACSLAYPTPQGRANLGRIRTLLGHASVVGYSDHTISSITGMYAVFAGATVIEKHVTMGGDPGKVADHAMGLSPQQFSLYATWIKTAETMVGDGVMGVHEGEAAAVQGARRGLFAAANIKEGERFTTENVVALRPAPVTDVHAPADAWLTLTGQPSPRSYSPGEMIGL